MAGSREGPKDSVYADHSVVPYPVPFSPFCSLGKYLPRIDPKEDLHIIPELQPSLCILMNFETGSLYTTDGSRTLDLSCLKLQGHEGQQSLGKPYATAQDLEVRNEARLL